ncbi:MAG: hypothetical protein AAF682_00120 [Planctomycetota bacterium]
MSNLTTTETQDLLQAARAELEAARRRHGEAIAGGDSMSSSETRVDIAAIEQRIADLEAALPVAEEREAEQLAADQAEAERFRKLGQNGLRAKHLAAAAKVQDAIAQLAVAYAELKATDRDVGGEFKDTSRCVRSRELLLRAAIYRANPDLAADLNMQRPRASTDIRPFEEHEAMLITEFEV